MALDFVWLDDRRDAKPVSLSYENWVALGPELGVLKSRTGVWIDPYSDARLSPDHARILADAIKARGSIEPDIGKLVLKLEESVEHSRWIQMVGD